MALRDRAMDALCVGMYRACSTWQYEVVAHLLERHRGVERLGYRMGSQYAGLPEAEAGGPWRVLKSHEEHPRFVRAIAEGRALAIYAYRDLRDVIFSMLHKRRVSFERFVRQGMIHQVLANDRCWMARPGVLVQRYEALIAEPARGVADLAARLGIGLAVGEAAEIAEQYSWRANRDRAAQLRRRLRADGVDLNDPSNAQRYDDRTLLHWNHLRDGKAGDWRTLATPAQRAVMARIGGPWLIARGYEADDSWVEVEAEARSTMPAPEPAELGSARRREMLMARGWVACTLRCASLRHPKTASAVKRLVGISEVAPPAKPHGPHPPKTSPSMRVDALGRLL